MESILGMLGVDKEDIMGVVSDLVNKLNYICMISEQNRLMITFLVNELSEEKKNELAEQLKKLGEKKNG